MPRGDYIAIDWGTTNRRIYLMRADGLVAHTHRDDRGVMQLSSGDYPDEIAAIREAHGDLPIIASGMVGSSRGWVDVPYCAAPATISDLAAAVHDCGEGVSIVPGVSVSSGIDCDVMRGEEVQVLGALLSGSIPEGVVFCQPGTHNKWVETKGGAITSLATAMTGEVYALLQSRSVLSEMLTGTVIGGPAFAEGVDRGMGAKDLLTALFQSRAAALLGVREGVDTASYVSGLLIGSDVGSRDLAGRQVALLASGDLAQLYRAGIEIAGAQVLSIDSNAAFAAGIHAIYEAM